MFRNECTAVHRLLVTILCLSLCPSFLFRRAEAQIGKRVQIQIGKPSVWSMGQAHYLLGDMRQKNRALKTRMPDEAALDPNAINATSIQLLRTLLDIRGSFDQKIAVDNASALREQSFSLRRRDEARHRLASKENEMDDLRFRIEDQERKLARLRKEKNLRDEERQKDEPLTAEDRARELRIAELESTLASNNAEKAKLQEEITALETTATANVGATSLTSAPLPEANAGGQLPEFEGIADYIKNSIGQVKQPSLSASIALDNYIGMQYEIIAKRLTLLRDEIGPDERIVFLELPSTIYTVPDKADNYIVQLRWTIKHYYKSDPQRARHTKHDDADRETEWDRIEKSLYGLRTSELSGVCAEEAKREQQQQQEQKQRQAQQQQAQRQEKKERQKQEESELNNKEPELNKKDGWLCVNTPPGERVDYIASVRDGKSTTEPDLRRAAVRALDVIPRQSGLNVNETYATANKKNFLGVFKLLSGIGLQVNYQRERQLYEQFLQQDIFASGFGKGREEFGWTFGPQPGTKRVSPGLRTTYAVLAVPRYASALEVEVEGVAYPRTQTPQYEHLSDSDKNQLVTRESFVVRIPNEITDKFFVNTVDYTPVKKGGSVTVKINGDNFSPQTGVLINAVPLTRALSLANNETADAANVTAPGSDVHGSFELMSSNDIMLTFNMGDDKFVGTPTITLVTPERTDSINTLPLDRVNSFDNRNGNRPSLKGLSSIEPMFTEGLSLREYVQKSSDEISCNSDTYFKGRLYGTGMLPNAEIEVDGRLIPQANRESIERYIADERKSFVTHRVDQARDRWKDSSEKIKAQEQARAERDALAAFDELAALESAFKIIEECEGDKTPREYVYQYSTGEYRIFARARNKNKFELRYRHQTAHGFDVATYKYETGEQPQIRRYIAEADKDHALVDLRIHTNVPQNRLSLSLGTEEGGPPTSVKYEGDNNYRAVFLVTDEKLGLKNGKAIMAKRETITVTIEDSQDSGVKQSFDVQLPVQPTITGVVNPRTGKAEGLAQEEPTVTISGRDLQQVKQVFFGNEEVPIVDGPNFDAIKVKVPSRQVLEGVKITVSVRVVTGANKVSLYSQYTFVGDSKAPPPPQPSTTPPKSG
jgi:hypothetical protein